MRKPWIAVVVSATLLAGCFRGGPLGFRLFEAALVTAVIISAVEPPPPRVVYIPPPRDGYVWQPGYWTQQDGNWAWIDGGWIQTRPSFQWSPTHWEHEPDGSWHLVPGQWIPA